MRTTVETGECDPVVLSLEWPRAMNHEIRLKSIEVTPETGALGIECRTFDSRRIAGYRSTPARGNDVKAGVLRQSSADPSAEIAESPYDDHAHHGPGR